MVIDSSCAELILIRRRIVINLVKAHWAKVIPLLGVIVYGADLRFECENCQLDILYVMVERFVW